MRLLSIIVVTILVLSLISCGLSDASPNEENVIVIHLSKPDEIMENLVVESNIPPKNVVEVVSVRPWVKIRFTDTEYNMFYRMVEAEATGGDLESKLNVANVILNRILSDNFPNTLEGVLFQERQFSPVSDGRYYTVEVTDSTVEAVNRANTELDTTNGSTFFMVRAHSDTNNVTWFDNNLEFVMKDDLGHEYFR